MSATPKTRNTFRATQLEEDDIAYYNRRFQNRVFKAVANAVIKEIRAGHVTQSELARMLGKDPGQLSRFLSEPSNCTLNSISTILLGIGAEMTVGVSFFRDQYKKNDAPNFVRQLEDALIATDTEHSLSIHSAHVNLDERHDSVTRTSYPTVDISIQNQEKQHA